MPQNTSIVNKGYFHYRKNIIRYLSKVVATEDLFVHNIYKRYENTSSGKPAVRQGTAYR